MIDECMVIDIFCIADDFCKEFETEIAKNSLTSSAVVQFRSFIE